MCIAVGHDDERYDEDDGQHVELVGLPSELVVPVADAPVAAFVLGAHLEEDLDPEDGRGEEDGADPGDGDDAFRLRHGANIATLDRIHDGVVALDRHSSEGVDRANGREGLDVVHELAEEFAEGPGVGEELGELDWHAKDY